MTTGVGAFEELRTHERTYTRVEASIAHGRLRADRDRPGFRTLGPGRATPRSVTPAAQRGSGGGASRVRWWCVGPPLGNRRAPGRGRRPSPAGAPARTRGGGRRRCPRRPRGRRAGPARLRVLAPRRPPPPG